MKLNKSSKQETIEIILREKLKYAKTGNWKIKTENSKIEKWPRDPIPQTFILILIPTYKLYKLDNDKSTTTNVLMDSSREY